MPINRPHRIVCICPTLHLGTQLRSVPGRRSDVKGKRRLEDLTREAARKMAKSKTFAVTTAISSGAFERNGPAEGRVDCLRLHDNSLQRLFSWCAAVDYNCVVFTRPRGAAMLSRSSAAQLCDCASVASSQTTPSKHSDNRAAPSR